MHRPLFIPCFLMLAAALVFGARLHSRTRAVLAHPVMRVGWISAMTGPVSKYGAHEAALLAVAEVNASGGIRGKRLELIMEDARCEGRAAAAAAQKLIEIDKVRFILGGHCSTETLTIAPIAEKKKVLTLASISSSPDLTNAGSYIFRTSPVSTQQSVLVSSYILKQLKLTAAAILFEDTQYVRPIAEALRQSFRSGGGQVVYFESFDPGTTDFRALLAGIKSRSAEAIFLGVQAQDTAGLLLRQLREINMPGALFGNEAVGSAVNVRPQDSALFEGLVFGEAAWPESDPAATEFIKKYKDAYRVEAVPYGIWTAESYDAVKLLAEVINRCGEAPEDAARCLLQVRDYPGASGSFSIDEHGDAVRRYVLKVVKGGKILEMPSKEGRLGGSRG